MRDAGGRRSGYQSPEAVLTEARRMADEIRRRAEREAAAIRRDAAKWASDARYEADQLRDQMVAQLEELERWTARLAEEHEQLRGEADVGVAVDDALEDVDDEVEGEVIDLRAAVARRAGADLPVPEVAPELEIADELEGVVDDDADEELDLVEVVEADHDATAAAGEDLEIVLDPYAAWRSVRSSVQGRGGLVETSLETKVHDVVRLAVRRTFERVYSVAGR